MQVANKMQTLFWNKQHTNLVHHLWIFLVDLILVELNLANADRFAMIFKVTKQANSLNKKLVLLLVD